MEDSINAHMSSMASQMASISSAPSPTMDVNLLIYDAVKHMPQPAQGKFASLLREFKDIISSSKADLGRTQAYTHTIPLRDNEPVFTKQFPLNRDEFSLINDNLREWMQIGIIEPANSPYNSPIF
jgi:hypothetical protein